MSTFINERRALTKEEAVELTLSYVKEALGQGIPEREKDRIDWDIEC